MHPASRLAIAVLLPALIMGVGAPARADAPLDQPPVAPVAEAGLYKSDAGPMTVKTLDETWKDPARSRTIPVRIFLPTPSTPGARDAPGADAPSAPAAGPAKFPVVVFSPGLGGSRINYGYFARHLASHGYIVLVLSHPGSDTAAALEWVRSHGGAPSGQRLAPNAEDDAPGGWLMSSTSNPDNLRELPRDVSFVLDRLPEHKTLGPIADTARIGVAGHSFGAYTAMAIGGMTVDLPEPHGGKARSFRDARVKAVLPMSPEGTGTMGIVEGAWKSFGVPVLFLTGTRDYGAGGRSASWRRQAFEAIRGVDAFLVTLQDAGHMTFGTPNGRALRGASDKGERHEALIDSLGVAFFDAYLRADARARQFMQKFAMPKRAECIAEFRPAASQPDEPGPGK
ncbi:MAG TPA: hypothetical protein PKE29_16605 [Phycisphaerales bacterium]|nr:hypothetical protein [Phycisphaerales bacterium]